MSETSPITEQDNPETELARDRSLADLMYDALETILRINAELENLSVDAGRTQVEEEEDVVNDSGRLVQPDAGGSSSGGLKRIPSMTRGSPFAVSYYKLGGRVHEENRKVIWSWLSDDEVSTIGIYGAGGIGKTNMLQLIHYELLLRQDISHHVYWVTVSQDSSIYRLQNLIARSLDLDLSSEYDILPRAAKLAEELMKKQEWILILDDLRESFELSAVGIPVPLKGCKVILTARSNDICQRMGSQVITEVRPLPEREARTLFMEKLEQGVPLSPEVERIAVDIARECAGLPLGIITLAGSLRGVDDQDEWRNTLEKLKELKSGDMEDEVFRVLRISYDRLDDVALQQCLLYCASFPKGHEIERESLIYYLIEGGTIENMRSREAVVEKGDAMLDRLEDAGLLQGIDGCCAVKMYNLVRDMAIRICKENPSVKIKDMAVRICKENPSVKIKDMAVRICKENPSVKIKDMAVRICEENPSAKMDYGGNRTERTIRRRRKRKESVEEIEAPDELKKLKGSKCRDMVDFLKSGWTLLLTNLILEITSAVFDQLGYALVGMVLAFVALLLSTADLIHMARKERMSLLPSFRRPSTRTLAPGKPVGTIVEYFGWVGAVWQCFYSTVEYAYARQKKDNPIKMTLLPFIFLLCVVISKLIKK